MEELTRDSVDNGGRAYSDAPEAPSAPRGTATGGPGPARRKRVTARRLAVLGLLVATLAVVRATLLAPAPAPVEVVAVARGRVEQTVTNSRAGTVKARRRAQLSPEVGGRVAWLPHREGDRVERGGVLLRMDDALARARLEVARRERASAFARSEQACLAAERTEREHRRQLALARDGIVSADVLDAAASAERSMRAACAAAAAGAEGAAAGEALARTELQKHRLLAPFGGVIARLSVEVGEWTTPSPPGLPIPPVIDFIDTSSIYVSAPMDEVDSARIGAGQRARITVDSHPGRAFEGRVVRAAPYVLDLEAQNRTLEVDAELDDADFARTLLPGTSADVEVILAVRDDVARIPTAAVLEGGKVLVVEGDRLAERAVSTGVRNWDFTEVVSGVAPGESVVVSLDRPEIQAGVRVRVVPEDK